MTDMTLTDVCGVQDEFRSNRNMCEGEGEGEGDMSGIEGAPGRKP